MAQLRLGGGADAVEAAAARLREVNGAIPANLQRVIVDAATVLAARARAAVLQEPQLHAKHTGLYESVAAGVGVQVDPTGATVTTSMPAGDEKSIPGGLDDSAGWQHPVFGNRRVWVTQHGSFSWFTDTMKSGESDVADRIQQVLQDAADRIAGS